MADKKIKNYDIVLTVLFARIHNYYLGIINTLSRECSIGVYVLTHEKAKRSPETNQVFLEYCEKLGADIIPPSGKAKTKILFIPQYDLETDVIAKLIAHVAATRTYSLQSFGLGAHFLDQYVSNSINHHIVFDYNIFRNKLKTPAEKQFAENSLTIKEMGDIFARYPLNEKIACDYMIAFPTNMSFEDDHAKRTFLHNVLNILETLKDDITVFKIHNVKDKGNRIYNGRLFNIIVDRLDLPLGILKAMNYMTDLVLNRINTEKATFLTKFLFQANLAAKYLMMLKKSVPLSSLTEYANLGIEMFLPGVRKGIITGRSSCVWHALAQHIPVYNCDNITTSQIENVSDSYEMFGIAPCFGKLSFDKINFNKISDNVQKADLIAMIKADLALLTDPRPLQERQA